jgi:hypothetical protein
MESKAPQRQAYASGREFCLYRVDSSLLQEVPALRNLALHLSVKETTKGYYKLVGCYYEVILGVMSYDF